jgi:hypothetical protein
MAVTVTQLRRALEEYASMSYQDVGLGGPRHAEGLLKNATAITEITNRLNDAGVAGNEAAARNLGDLRRLADALRLTANRAGAPGCAVREEAATQLKALEWAIDQLRPRQRPRPVS